MNLSESRLMCRACLKCTDHRDPKLAHFARSFVILQTGFSLPGAPAPAGAPACAATPWRRWAWHRCAMRGARQVCTLSQKGAMNLRRISFWRNRSVALRHAAGPNGKVVHFNASLTGGSAPSEQGATGHVAHGYPLGLHHVLTCRNLG